MYFFYWFFCLILLSFGSLNINAKDLNLQDSSDPKKNFFFDFFKKKKRQHIHIVGSSTVYPFSATIAENFGYQDFYKTPIVEATGTGGGFKIFCSGIGFDYPDLVNASRRIQKSEISKCQENGISVGEIKIGYDGIVLANSIQGIDYNLTLEEIFFALASQVPDPKNPLKLIANPYQRWSDIDPKLSNQKIIVYGPPPTSGTRDSFSELVMEKTCLKISAFVKNYPDEKIRAKKCQLIRSDGIFIEAGENDNLIVQKLKNNPIALGIFGFSFLEENRQLIKASKINNFIASQDNIISGSYQISRPLFIYFKKEHLDLIFAMRQFISEIISNNTLGFEGYLLQKGLIPLTDLELKNVRDEVEINLKN